MTMPQVDNLQYGNMEDYCDVYHLDTAVIIWRAEDVEGANRARDYIKTLRLDDIEVGMYYTAGFGPLAGFVFFAFGVDGASEEDAAVVDQVAAGFACETEMWIGSADEITQLKELSVPEYVKVA